MISLKNRQRPKPESGYTIIESIVAILVVSFAMIAIAPVIVYSVGTRVQTRRIELATQAARTYIDGVKSGAIPAPTVSNTDLQTVGAPTRADFDNLFTSNQLYDGNLYCVNFDETPGCQPDSLVDMVVQGSGFHPNSTDPRDGYQLGVRVYRANSFATDEELVLETNSTDSATTNALGKRNLPLIQMTTEVLPRNANFQGLTDRLKQR